MRVVGGALLCAGAILGQLVLTGYWPRSANLFDLPLVVVLYYALDRGPTPGLLLGGAVGLIEDALTGSLLGAGAVARGLVGYLIGSAGTRLVLIGPFPLLFLAAAGTLLSEVLEAATLALMGRRLVIPPILGLLTVAAGNGLVGGALLALRNRENRP